VHGDGFVKAFEVLGRHGGAQWLSPWFSRLALAWVTLGHSLEARLDPVIARKSRVVIWWRGRQGAMRCRLVAHGRCVEEGSSHHGGSGLGAGCMMEVEGWRPHGGERYSLECSRWSMERGLGDLDDNGGRRYTWMMVILGYNLEARLDPVIARKSRMVIWWRGRQGDGGVSDVGSLDAAAAGVVGGFYGDGGRRCINVEVGAGSFAFGGDAGVVSSAVDRGAIGNGVGVVSGHSGGGYNRSGPNGNEGGWVIGGGWCERKDRRSGGGGSFASSAT